MSEIEFFSIQFQKKYRAGIKRKQVFLKKARIKSEKNKKVCIFALATAREMVCRESAFLYSADVNLDTSRRH